MAEEQQRDTLKATLESLFCRNHKLHHITMCDFGQCLFDVERKTYFYLFFLFFLAFDFCRFCLFVFHPRHNGQ